MRSQSEVGCTWRQASYLMPGATTSGLVSGLCVGVLAYEPVEIGGEGCLPHGMGRASADEVMRGIGDAASQGHLASMNDSRLSDGLGGQTTTHFSRVYYRLVELGLNLTRNPIKRFSRKDGISPKHAV